MRTRKKHSRNRRTRIVHNCLCRTISFALSIAFCSGTGLGQSSGQEETRGWLQLKSEQRVYRERVEPLEPRDEAYLEQLEQRQERQLRALQSKQRRDRDADRRRDRMRHPEQRVRVTPGSKQRRELERQRLNRRIQRETFRYGRW